MADYGSAYAPYGGCSGEMYGGDCACGPNSSNCGCGPCDCDPYCDGGGYGPFPAGGDAYCEPCYVDGVECGGDWIRERRCRNPHVSLFADYLWLQVSDVDFAHAQQQDGLGGAGTVPYGDIGTVGMDYDDGYRVGGSIACGPCSSVLVSYTHFESNSFDSVVAPDISGGGGAVGSLVQHPGAAITASAGPVNATYDIDFQLGDVVCRNIWRQGPRYLVAWMLGGQYGHLDQDFAQTGVFSGGQQGTVDTATTIDFDGGGVKAGLDAERRLGLGFSVYGRLTAAVMTGRFNSRYSMVNSTTDTLLAQANWKDDRTVSQVEYEVGISLTSMDCHWRGTLGYMLSHWDNVVTTADFIDAVQADNYTNVGDGITFDGFVGRVECRW